MKALKIVLHQNQANYRKEETIDNKMTYPLPPFSTVIGAIHKACGYKEYKEMQIGIQGKYDSMQKEPYYDSAFLNSTMNDRGILVKMKNSQSLSTAYEVVAEAVTQGADFENELKIRVINRELLGEYQSLRRKRKELDSEKKFTIDPKLKDIKLKIKESKAELKGLDKATQEYANKKNLLEEMSIMVTDIEKEFQKRKELVENEYAKFASLTKSLKYYEVLYNVELIIHVVATDEVMECIKENAYNIMSIGRSEDFVDVESTEFVELQDTVDENVRVRAGFSGYIYPDAHKNNNLDIVRKTKGGYAEGTKYYVNKNYEVVNGQRKFTKVWVLYTSGYSMSDESKPRKGNYYKSEMKISELDKHPIRGIYYDGEDIVNLF